MKRISVLTISAFALCAVPAFAQSGRTMAPSGVRVEALVGYDGPSFDVGTLAPAPTPTPTPKAGTTPVKPPVKTKPQSENISGGGIAYGGRLGFDIPVSDSISLGADLEMMGTSIKKSFQNKLVRGSFETGRDIYAGGRVTAAVSEGVNLYLMAGYTSAQFVTKHALVATPNVVKEVREDRSGIRAGVGAQFALTRNAYALTEYRYSNYEAGFQRHQLLAGVGFRF